MMGWFYVLALTLVVLQVANRVHAMSCQEAIVKLAPCQPFLIWGEAKPTEPCCLSVKTVNDQAKTKEDRKALCECFKQAGPVMGVKPEKAKQLPDLCGIQVPVPIDPNVDCSK